MTYNDLAELFKREGGDAQVCFSVISQNQILFGNNDTKKDIISFKNEEPIKWVKEAQEEPVSKEIGDYDHKAVMESLHPKLKEEPVSEDLEEAVNAYIGYAPEIDESSSVYGKRQAFKAGAEWQKSQGVTEEAVIGITPKEYFISISQSTVDALDLCAGDKVIVQLRKKEDKI